MFTIIYCKINFWSYCHKYMSFPASWAHGANFKDVPDVTWEALGKCPSNRNLERTVYND